MRPRTICGWTTLTWLALAGLLVGNLSIARAQPITIGPYWFPDESPFADTAAYHGDYPQYQWRPPIWDGSGEHLLIGFTPESNRSNLGMQPDSTTCAPNRELLDFGFTDVLAVNGPGPDIVVFDARLSADHYEVAVRPVGGSLTTFRFYMAADQRPTGWSDQPGRALWGVDIDLSDYGIDPGVPVDLVRIAGDCRTAPPHPSRPDEVPWAELDPAMAAVLNRPCPCDDGDPCTFDCDASGACVSRPHDPGTPCSGGVCDGNPTPACVECVDDAQCPSERPRCDPGANVCVACLADAECDDGDECTQDVCEAGSCDHPSAPAGSICAGGMCDGEPEPSCVSCLENAHCDDALECTLDECVDAECQSTPLAPGTPCEDGVCDGDVSSPRCVPCLSDDDCGALTPYCIAGACVACRGPSDCPANACARERRCVEGACDYPPLPSGAPCEGGLCNGDPEAPACVECLADAQCEDDDPCTESACVDGACTHTRTCDADGGLPIMDGGAGEPRAAGCGCRAAATREPPFLLTILAGVIALRRRRARHRRSA